MGRGFPSYAELSPEQQAIVRGESFASAGHRPRVQDPEGPRGHETPHVIKARPAVVNAWANCSPVAWARPRWDSVRRRTFTDPRAEKGAREQAACLRGHGPAEPLTGPISVWLTYLMPIPPSWTKARREAQEGEPHAQKPDVDNLAKLTLDAISRLGWWKDDAQVARLVVAKRWSGVPGVHVRIEAMS